jgi:hypothetical protein
LFEWSEIGSLSNDYRTGVGYDPVRPNYALLLSGDEQKEVTHNRFVVPEWGSLRFNLHVPNPNGGLLKVSMKGSEPNDKWIRLKLIPQKSLSPAAYRLSNSSAFMFLSTPLFIL